MCCRTTGSMYQWSEDAVRLTANCGLGTRGPGKNGLQAEDGTDNFQDTEFIRQLNPGGI